jgi:pilus assembly protein CpaC
MKKFLKVTILSFFVLLVSRNYSLGDDSPRKNDSMTLYKGDIKIIAVSNPSRIVISNPDIIDVTSVSKTDMIISAKGQGTTNLIWRDDSGSHTSQVDVLLENMNPIKQRVDNILKEMNFPGVTTSSIDSEGKVLLLGSVKTAQDLERINIVLGSLKTKIMNLVQVKEEETVIAIDAQVLELDKDATSTLGFTFPGSTTITELGSPALAAAGTTWGKLFNVLNVSRDAFTLTLDALVQEGKAHVLSQPRLSCQSGKEAELLVGGEVPILTTSVAATTGASGTTVDYKEYGIKLKIKPVVTPDKKIKLAINMEVSEVGTVQTLGSAGSPTAKAYPITKRNASTELFLNDGQTMAIGGLKKQKTEEDVRKTPFLGDVPILGFFFRKKTAQSGGGQGQRGDIELFITLTPTIVKEAVKKEELKPEVKPEAPASKKEEKPAEKDKAKAPVISKEGAKKESAKPKAAAVASAQDKTVTEASKLQTAYAQTKISPTSEYVRKIAQQIRRNLVYPWTAKEANMEGSLKVALRVYYTGQLMDVAVKESSGHAVLDENTVSIVKKLAPYPPFPPEMKQRELWIDLPIAYKAK